MENLQRTGAYKDRGAMNAVLGLDDAHKKAGVLAASAGNHAQGLAFAAQCNGIHATIVMPETAPLSKQRGTEQYGAEIVLHGNSYDDAFQRATELQGEKATPSFTHLTIRRVIAGQGTVVWNRSSRTLIWRSSRARRRRRPAAGMAVALKEINPKARIVGVQAENIASMKASVEAGRS